MCIIDLSLRNVCRVHIASSPCPNQLIFSLALQPPWALVSDFQFYDHVTDGRTLGRVINSSQGLYLNTGQHKHRINIYTYQTFMTCVGFGPTIPASERAKTVHVLDRSATVTGKTTT
jgi:hypothetical protein